MGPGKTIPRSIVLGIGGGAALYVTMPLGVLGAVPVASGSGRRNQPCTSDNWYTGRVTNGSDTAASKLSELLVEDP